MTIVLDGSQGISTPMYNGAIASNQVTPTLGFKNKIINGAMVIDQRNAGASGTASGYTVDRWAYYANQSNKATWQQNAGSVTPPAGFVNYLGFTSSSSYSSASGDLFEAYQMIEGYNIADLAWGTVNAKTVTLSFWVRSSLTGTFAGFLTNSANTQIYPFTYSISATNTWQQISLTIVGPTSGTWLTTNGQGVQISFDLGSGSSFNASTPNTWGSSGYFASGSVKVLATNGATFYITGVQLEVGSSATSFDYRPYTTELQLCQRYYIKITGSSATICNGGWSSSTVGSLYWAFPTTMRTNPTLASTSSGFTLQNLGPGADGTNATVGSGNNFSTYGVAVQASCGSSGASVGYPCWLTTNASSSYLSASAEL